MGINGVSSYANTYTYGNVKNEIRRQSYFGNTK